MYIDVCMHIYASVHNKYACIYILQCHKMYDIFLYWSIIFPSISLTMATKLFYPMSAPQITKKQFPTFRHLG